VPHQIGRDVGAGWSRSKPFDLGFRERRLEKRAPLLQRGGGEAGRAGRARRGVERGDLGRIVTRRRRSGLPQPRIAVAVVRVDAFFVILDPTRKGGDCGLTVGF
jgi:hypothetical protein